MKKKFIIFIALLVLVVGCSNKKEESSNTNSNTNQVITIETYGNKDGVVVQYEKDVSVSGQPDLYVSVTNAEGQKRIVFTEMSISNEQVHSKTTMRTLSDKEYQQIIDLAFANRFLNLDGDLSISGANSADNRYITVYYNNISFRTGGQNVNNTLFTDLENLLLGYRNEAE